MKLLDSILVSVIAYLFANTALNFGGRADPRSMQYAVPLVVGALVACVSLFVRFRRRNESAVSIGMSVLVVLAAVLGACLILGTIAGKMVWFVLFGLVPFAAWRCAKAFLPAHTGLVTGAAFGLVITLVGRGLFSLLEISGLGQVLFLIGLASSLIHESLAYQLAEWFGLGPYNQGDEYFVFRVAPIGGAFWALVYGLLGALLDRARARRRLRPGRSPSS